MSDARSSDPVDPLQGHVGFALFPNSFKSIPPVPSSNPFDLHVIDSRLKPLALQHSPSKLKALEKLSGTLEILKSGDPQASKQKNEVLEKAEENPRQRRPALGLKRTRFSMKPDSSQPAMSLLPTFDPKNYKDSEEMWEAYDRHECAKKEIKKHMGGNELDADQHNPSPIKRSRRQGLLGRSVQYKPLYPLTDYEISENGTFSQDTFETSNHSPLNHSLQPEPKENVALEEMDLADSIDKEVDKLNDILGLQPRNIEEAVSLLQGHLKIKPFEVEKLCLPELVKPTRRTSIKPTNVLKDIDNLVKGKSSNTPVKLRKGAEGSIHLASPTPPRSPFASFSALNKRIFQSNSSSDPFSADDIDQFPETNTSLVENGNKQSELDMGEQLADSDLLKSTPIEQTDHTKVTHTGSPEVRIEEFSHAFERYTSEDSIKVGAGIDVGSSRSHVDMEDDTGGSNTDNRIMDDTLSRSDADMDTQENGANDWGKVEDKLEEAVASAVPELNVADSTSEKSNGTENDLDQIPAAEEHPTDGLSRNLDTGLETHNERIVEDSGVPLNKQIKETSCPRRKQKSKRVPKRQSLAAVEEHPTDGLSRNLDTAPETQEEIMQEHSEVSPNQQMKENLRPLRKQKSREVSKRHSLAGAGTLWQSGVRRSTRIRTRPLEHWKGERLLYGRIHNSLPTVIGMKYASPGKGDGRAPLKVKSFVSDEYKELVELAALH